MSEGKLQIDCPKCGEPVFVSDYFKSQAALIEKLEKQRKREYDNGCYWSEKHKLQEAEFYAQAARITRLETAMREAEANLHALIFGDYCSGIVLASCRMLHDALEGEAT